VNKYKSGLEKRIAKQLTDAEVDFEYETKKYTYVTIRNYKPDFILKNGIYIECKGWHKGFSEALRKLVAVKEQHPDLDLRIVWENLKTKTYPKSKMTVEDWSKKHGFIYAEKEIPQKWLNVKWV
jgi:hypothetical protein